MLKYNKKKLLTLLVQLLGIVILVFADLFIKQIVVDNIALYEDVPFLNGILGWTYVQNTGIAWSMLDSNPQLLSVFTGILIFAVFVYLILPVKRPAAYDICIPIILAGGTANLIDRVMRGFVVDYIKTLFVDFPVYNFADCLITCGAFALIIYLIYEIIRDSRKNSNAQAEENNNG